LEEISLREFRRLRKERFVVVDEEDKVVVINGVAYSWKKYKRNYVKGRLTVSRRKKGLSKLLKRERKKLEQQGSIFSIDGRRVNEQLLARIPLDESERIALIRPVSGVHISKGNRQRSQALTRDIEKREKLREQISVKFPGVKTGICDWCGWLTVAVSSKMKCLLCKREW